VKLYLSAAYITDVRSARPEKLGQGLSPQRALCTYIKCELNLYINDLELFYFYRERRRRPDETSPVEVSKFINSIFATIILSKNCYREKNYFCFVGVRQMSMLWNSTQIDTVLKLTQQQIASGRGTNVAQSDSK
jgi:hypothetical protein